MDPEYICCAEMHFTLNDSHPYPSIHYISEERVNIAGHYYTGLNGPGYYYVHDLPVGDGQVELRCTPIDKCPYCSKKY